MGPLSNGVLVGTTKKFYLEKHFKQTLVGRYVEHIKEDK